MFKTILNLMINGSLMGGVFQALLKDFTKDFLKKLLKDEKGTILILIGMMYTIPTVFNSVITGTKIEWCKNYIDLEYGIITILTIILVIYRQLSLKTDSKDVSHEDEYIKTVDLLREYACKAQLKKFCRLANSYKNDNIINIDLKKNKVENTEKYEYIATVKYKDDESKKRTITYSELND